MGGGVSPLSRRGGEPPLPRRGIARLCLARNELGKIVNAIDYISNELPSELTQFAPT